MAVWTHVGERCWPSSSCVRPAGTSCSSWAASEAVCQQNARRQTCQVSDTWRGRNRRGNGDGPARVVPSCTAWSVALSGRVRLLLQPPEPEVGEVAQGICQVTGPPGFAHEVEGQGHACGDHQPRLDPRRQIKGECQGGCLAPIEKGPLVPGRCSEACARRMPRPERAALADASPRRVQRDCAGPIGGVIEADRDRGWSLRVYSWRPEQARVLENPRKVAGAASMQRLVVSVAAKRR